MNYSDIYFQSNEQLFLKNLLPIDEKHFEEMNKSYWNSEYAELDFSEWRDVMTQSGYDVNRIKRNINLNTMRQYFYEGEYITVEINTLDPSWLTNDFTIGCLKADDMAKELFESKNYTLYFFSEQNLFAIDYFHRHYEKIETEDKYQAFKTMYLYCNYGFEYFDKDILSEVFTLADSEDSIEKLKNKTNEQLLTIYRGMGDRSTPIDSAYSWTLSLSVAQRFAHHFSRGKVYQAKVNINDVIDYIEERNEDEVWVRFDSLQNVLIIED